MGDVELWVGVLQLWVATIEVYGIVLDGELCATCDESAWVEKTQGSLADLEVLQSSAPKRRACAKPGSLRDTHTLESRSRLRLDVPPGARAN